jgi:hypothetical protein
MERSEIRGRCINFHIDPRNLFIRGVKVLLKPQESIANERHAPELRRGIVDGVVLQLQQGAEFLLIEFADALRDEASAKAEQSALV